MRAAHRRDRHGGRTRQPATVRARLPPWARLSPPPRTSTLRASSRTRRGFRTVTASCRPRFVIALRSSLHALRTAVGGAVGDRAGLAPSLHLGEAALALPHDATAIGGLAANAPDAAERWLATTQRWVTGAPDGVLAAPHLELPVRLWAVLHAERALGFSGERLVGAIPAGDAFLVAIDPARFFAQALTCLDAHDTRHGRRMAERLRSPSANLATVGKLVDTVAMSLALGEQPALRLRLRCADTPAAFQVSVLLQAWRARRASGADVAAQAFARSTVHRGATRVEMTFPGSVAQVLGLIAPPSA